jgi:hypothetical protein
MSRHVRCASENGSELTVLAFVITGLGGLMMPPEA